VTGLLFAAAQSYQARTDEHEDKDNSDDDVMHKSLSQWTAWSQSHPFIIMQERADRYGTFVPGPTHAGKMTKVADVVV
jgi:hypothetical protein